MTRRLLTSLGALFVTLAALEISLQGLYYANAGAPLFARQRIAIHTAHPSSGFFNKPNLSFDHNTNEFRIRVDTNSAGLRVAQPGIEYGQATPAGVKRALLLGPSFAFGWGVNYGESFAARLEDLLGAQVINAGVPALGPFAQFRWYEDVGRRYEVDVVIQIVYGSMDVRRSLDDYTVDDRGYLLANNQTMRERAAALGKQSGLLFYSWVLSTKLLPSLPAEIYGVGRRIRAPRPFSEHDDAVQEGLAYYAAFRDTVRHADATPLVVFAPPVYVVHETDAPRWRHLGVTDVPAHVAFDRAFCALVDARGLRCVNLTPTLLEAAASDKGRLYNWLDIHWTPRGNDVAARTTVTALKEIEF